MQILDNESMIYFYLTMSILATLGLSYIITFKYIMYTNIGPLSTKSQEYSSDRLAYYAHTCALLAVISTVIVLCVVGLIFSVMFTYK